MKAAKPSVPSALQTEASSAPALHIIKKYPNRRLYDTASSAYITMAQVRDLVMQRKAFAVRDAKTGEDLTRSILLQIILEEEAGGSPMFSEAVLANIIRFYGHAMQSFMGQYLEKNVQAFMEMQATLAEAPGLSPELWRQFMQMQAPVMQGMLGNYLQQSQAALADVQKQVQAQVHRQTEQVLGAFGIQR